MIYTEKKCFWGTRALDDEEYIKVYDIEECHEHCVGRDDCSGATYDTNEKKCFLRGGFSDPVMEDCKEGLVGLTRTTEEEKLKVDVLNDLNNERKVKQLTNDKNEADEEEKKDKEEVKKMDKDAEKMRKKLNGDIAKKAKEMEAKMKLESKKISEKIQNAKKKANDDLKKQGDKLEKQIAKAKKEGKAKVDKFKKDAKKKAKEMGKKLGKKFEKCMKKGGLEAWV